MKQVEAPAAAATGASVPTFCAAKPSTDIGGGKVVVGTAIDKLSIASVLHSVGSVR
jgi:hypothetical protein